MFQNETLQEYLAQSYTIHSKSAIIAEWNMNVPGNIQKVGNYRYRKNSTNYNALPDSFDMFDSGKFYTGATEADVVINYGYEDDEQTPLLFKTIKEKEKMYYSLEDCLKPFRPRSGINKLSYFTNKYLSYSNKNMYLRPRYYMPHKDDEFKYWRSYRTESSPTISNGASLEYGISKNNSNFIYEIDDANPFVVYKEEVPANRIVLKVQTHTGLINLGPFQNSDGSVFDDPFFGKNNKTVPQNFKVEYLNSNNKWITAAEFNSASFRDDLETPIIAEDGTLVLQYGLQIPKEYKNNFDFIEYVTSYDSLPTQTAVGSAYIIVLEPQSRGTLAIFNGTSYDFSIPNFTWDLASDEIDASSTFLFDFTNPHYIIESGSLEKIYKEFCWVKGLRLSVSSMSKPNVPLELIEISPRLVANITDVVEDFQVTKVLSDLGGSTLPVGQIMASTGSISIFDADQAFNDNNIWSNGSGSIIAKYLSKNIKFNFFEVIQNLGSDIFYVPIKTLYSDNMPQVNNQNSLISISLRDFYFYFESTKAPKILLQEVSLSQAICILLDSVGFSNYVFKRTINSNDPIIPNFFIAPEQSVAEVLSQLAIATQSAMFFDEYNNFVVMTKEYILDNSKERKKDITLYGNNTSDGLENIVAISSQDQKVMNSGTINYTSRSIARTYGSISQSSYVDKSWIYKPSLLWEVSGTASTTSLTNQTQAKYSLSAMPINTDLTSSVPSVSGNVLINNKIDLGENAYWITRFTGLLYANGEIIKYDAVEYNVAGVGNVWINSTQEYQNYFSQIPFNGKIYPTGFVRIYAEPYYETNNGIVKMKNGPVVKHGRGQFGTTIVSHDSGLNSYWTDNKNVQGVEMKSEYLYTTQIDPTLPNSEIGEAGLSKTLSEKSQRTGIIKNLMSSKYSTETNLSSLKTTKDGTVQASALVMTGPDFLSTDTPRNFLSYVWKPIEKRFPHIGTRVRILGRVESLGDMSQSPVGSMTYYNVPGIDPTTSVTIGGGSAGISLVNPATNVGYYFEIAALTSGNIQSYLNKDTQTGESSVSLDNINFYKIQKESSSTKAIPIKLWGGIGNILVDSGDFAGQYRFVNSENPSVYDLSIEYVDIENTRVFYLYINGKLIKTVVDQSPIALVNPAIGLFVRGSSKAMFENIYALGKNYANNSVFDLNVPIASVFGDEDGDVNAVESLNKYALSGAIQKTYLSGINANNSPEYNIYFEEFGTIMRECAYFNVKYDRAYPAIYAKIAPTLNRIKGYTISGFTADSYGAEFLIFNNTDTVLNLDETSGNFLRIIGVTFTQDTTNTISLDDYYNNIGNPSNPELKGTQVIKSPDIVEEEYDKIKISRMLHGKNEFSLQSPYIQDYDTASSLLGWIGSKNLKPRKSVGVEIFSNPLIQLGDIVNIHYKEDNVDIVASEDTNFVVYNISYKKNVGGPDMTIFLSEV